MEEQEIREIEILADIVGEHHSGKCDCEPYDDGYIECSRCRECMTIAKALHQEFKEELGGVEKTNSYHNEQTMLRLKEAHKQAIIDARIQELKRLDEWAVGKYFRRSLSTRIGELEAQLKNPHIGSSFNDFMEKEGSE